MRRVFKISWREFLLFTAFFIFSSLLMWKTFRLTSVGEIKIAAKVWSDFAATLPLIRSFSEGSNFPPEYPLFAGPPIRYHFAFFALVGFLEKLGLSLDVALNSLSAVSFFLLLALIYLVGRVIFKSKAIGAISAILFLFNGSFGFLEYFKKHSFSVSAFQNIFVNNEFSSFGPYDGKIVSAFWNLNIFTNQRHLALAYAAFLLLILVIYYFSQNPQKFSWSKAFFLGFFIGVFPFIHLAVFAMMGLALLVSFSIYSKIRFKLLTAGVFALILALPQYFYMGASAVEAKLFDPGYLVQSKTFLGYLNYWFMNLGLTMILAPVGFILADKAKRKFFLPFLALFTIGNIFRFTPEIAANHKFFNLFLIGANFFTALSLIKLRQVNFAGKLFSTLLIFPLVFTGIIELFPIFNDTYVTVNDIPRNKTAAFIVKNTNKESVILNSSFLYDPASLAGRKIYLGWPYFSWSAGYDTTARHEELKKILDPNNKSDLCAKLKKEKVDYIEIQNPTPLEATKINYSFFDQNFSVIFEEPREQIKVYDVTSSCSIF